MKLLTLVVMLLALVEVFSLPMPDDTQVVQTAAEDRKFKGGGFHGGFGGFGGKKGKGIRPPPPPPPPQPPQPMPIIIPYYIPAPAPYYPPPRYSPPPYNPPQYSAPQYSPPSYSSPPSYGYGR